MKRFAKLITFMIACILTVSAVIGITASADSSSDIGVTASVRNVEYGDMIKLAVAVEIDESVDKNTVGMLFWYYDYPTKTVENAIRSDSLETDGSKYYFLSEGISAKDMSSQIYYTPCIVDKTDGSPTEGQVIAWTKDIKNSSIVDYAVDRLSEQNGTAAQNRLYVKMIEYAGASNNLLYEDSDFAIVEAVDGYVGKYYASMIGATKGEELLLRAEASNADGEYFIEWQLNGETFSTERVTKTNPVSAAKTVYTAVYGNKAASAYATTYLFETLANNEDGLLFTPAEPSTDTIKTDTWSGITYTSKAYSKTFDSMKISLRYSLAYTKDDVTTNWTADDQAKVWLETNSRTGDVNLVGDKVAVEAGISYTFTNTAPDATNSFEFDVSWDEYSNSTPTQVRLSTGNGVFAGFSISWNETAGVTVQMDGTAVASSTVNDISVANDNRQRYLNENRIAYKAGETLTFKFVVDFTAESGLPEVDVYVNGDYYGTAGVYKEVDGVKYYDLCSRTAGKTYTDDNKLTSCEIFQLRATTADHVIDNVTFLATVDE